MILAGENIPGMEEKAMAEEGVLKHPPVVPVLIRNPFMVNLKTILKK